MNICYYHPHFSDTETKVRLGYVFDLALYDN